MAGYIIQPGETPEQLALRRQLARSLMEEGGSFGPVGHWTQGLARMAAAGFGGYEFYRAGEEDRKGQEQANQLLTSALSALSGDSGGGGGYAAPPASSGPSSAPPAITASGGLMPPQTSPAAGAAAAAGREPPPEYVPLARQM